MRWKRVRGTLMETARTFLIEREERCVSATARFMETAAKNDWKKSTAWLGFSENVARSLLFFAPSGTLYPIMDEPDDQGNHRAISAFLISRRIRSVQGTAKDVLVVERAIGTSPARFLSGEISWKADPIDYDLMRLTEPPRPEAMTTGPLALRVREAGTMDAERLFPMQAAYEVEEVIPEGGTFNAAASRLGLERTLRCGKTTLFAELDGEIVAKAGINAQAATYDQVGGVYVIPEHRGKGIATRLVAELCSRIVADSRRAALFVKKRNTAARKAYEKIGFSASGDYRITYYL